MNDARGTERNERKEEEMTTPLRDEDAEFRHFVLRECKRRQLAVAEYAGRVVIRDRASYTTFAGTPQEVFDFVMGVYLAEDPRALVKYLKRIYDKTDDDEIALRIIRPTITGAAFELSREQAPAVAS